jgi:hypothetical protein
VCKAVIKAKSGYFEEYKIYVTCSTTQSRTVGGGMHKQNVRCDTKEESQTRGMNFGPISIWDLLAHVKSCVCPHYLFLATHF